MSNEKQGPQKYILRPGDEPPIAPVRGAALPEGSYHGIDGVPGAVREGGKLVLSAHPHEVVVNPDPLQGPPDSSRFHW